MSMGIETQGLQAAFDELRLARLATDDQISKGLSAISSLKERDRSKKHTIAALVNEVSNLRAQIESRDERLHVLEQTINELQIQIQPQNETQNELLLRVGIMIRESEFELQRKFDIKFQELTAGDDAESQLGTPMGISRDRSPHTASTATFRGYPVAMADHHTWPPFDSGHSSAYACKRKGKEPAVPNFTRSSDYLDRDASMWDNGEPPPEDRSSKLQAAPAGREEHQQNPVEDIDMADSDRPSWPAPYDDEDDEDSNEEHTVLSRFTFRKRRPADQSTNAAPPEPTEPTDSQAQQPFHKLTTRSSRNRKSAVPPYMVPTKLAFQHKQHDGCSDDA